MDLSRGTVTYSSSSRASLGCSRTKAFLCACLLALLFALVSFCFAPQAFADELDSSGSKAELESPNASELTNANESAGAISQGESGISGIAGVNNDESNGVGENASSSLDNQESTAKKTNSEGLDNTSSGATQDDSVTENNKATSSQEQQASSNQNSSVQGEGTTGSASSASETQDAQTSTGLLGTSATASTQDDEAEEEVLSQSNNTYKHEIILEPGESRDVSSAQSSTVYIIDKAGKYTLSGQTSKAHVVVRADGVQLYLANGLSITPSGSAISSGNSCPAINIEDFDGTVEIISKAGATATFKSHGYAAAIQKDGLKTKLVFKTEDESKPGTIKAYANFLGQSAGIGSHYKGQIRVESCTGNMVFESGKIIAEGGRSAAGIGGANLTLTVKGITIKGTANIKATGHHFGAGIGSGGTCTELDDINIEGGTISAYGGAEDFGGAGIGYGGWDHTASTYGTITISGGTIKAVGGTCGAGIGGASRSNFEKILITGGTIKASSRRLGCGIGSGGFPTVNGEEETEELQSWGCSSIEITGGDITARGGDSIGTVGIGNSNRCDGNQCISIKGGLIRAYSGNSNYSYAIGGGAKTSLTSKIHVSIDISGGTIYAQQLGKTKDAAFGSFSNAFKNPKDFLKCTISGGSIIYDSSNKVGTFQVTPQNLDGLDVYPNTVHLAGITSSANSPMRVDVSGATTQFYGMSASYSLHDVLAVSLADIAGSGSEDVIFYPWVNENAMLMRFSLKTQAGDVEYYRSPYDEDPPDYYPQTIITLDANSMPDGTNGRTVAYYGMGTILDSLPSAPGYKVTFFTSGESPSSTLVMEGDGRLIKNVTVDGEVLTNDHIDWMYKGGLTGKVEPRTLTFYAQFEPIEYRIVYDANQPQSATSQVTGNLPATVNARGGDAYTIGEGGSLALQGYKLSSWNTKADGSGTTYEDGDLRGNLTAEDGATVILYAQWKQLSYQISFDGGAGATGSMLPVDAIVDTAVTLPASVFKREGYLFAGWQAGAAIGGIIEDGASVINQCLRDEDGNYVFDSAGNLIGLTLKAIWLNESELDSDACVVVTKDGQAVTGLSDRTASSKLAIETLDHATCYTPFTEEIKGGITVYTVKNEYARMLPQGTYFVILDDVNTGKTLIIDGKSELCQIACFTVTTSFDQMIDRVDRTFINRANVLESNVFISGTQLTYKSIIEGVNKGYSFGRWVFRGVAPTLLDGTSKTSNPVSIEVNGTMELIAKATLTKYEVSFKANGSDVSGSMSNQKCVCHTEFTLSRNEFSRTGYTFAGWNTRADGLGTSYEDGARVENLTLDGSTAVLYAQWQPITYKVYFDGNHGDGTMKPMTLDYDKEYALSKCAYSLEDAMFTGWNTSRDGSGTTYGDSDVVLNLRSNQGDYVVLYAQWQEEEPRAYVVSFDSAGGSEIEDLLVAAGEPATQPADPTRSGYTFKGWLLDALAYDFKTPVTADITLTASWEKIEDAPDSDGSGSSGEGGTQAANLASMQSSSASPSTGDSMQSMSLLVGLLLAATAGLICAVVAMRMRKCS